jgi:membrane protein implicated in regulation of membrane protease activity
VPVSPLGFRWLTLVTAAFLAFDGAALSGLGIWSGRRAILVAGLVLLFSSGLVLVFWRRHLRRLEEINQARRDLRDEAEDLRRLLRG